MFEDIFIKLRHAVNKIATLRLGTKRDNAKGFQVSDPASTDYQIDYCPLNP